MKWILVIIAVISGIFGGNKYRSTVVVVGDKVVVKSFDPVTNSGIILRLPDNLEIETVGGRGKWQAGVITKAGTKKWVADSVADYLGISYQGTEGVLPARVKLQEVDLGDTSFVTGEKTVDGVKVMRLNSSWETKVREWFFSSVVANESMTVTVVNTTEVPGLGAHAARVLESAGIKVGMVANKPEEVDKCIVRSKEEQKKSYTVGFMKRAFGCKWEKGEEVILEVGKEYEKWWMGS